MSSTSAPTRQSIDEAVTRAFHFRMSAFVGGGQFIDGYILGVIAIALVLIPSNFGLTPVWKGLIGSSALIGTFAGSLVFGWVADHIGRKALYTADLSIFLIGSVAQFFVVNPWQLFSIRLVVGIAIGIDYAVGPTYLAEFAPRRSRGRLAARGSHRRALGSRRCVALGAGQQCPACGRRHGAADRQS
jgi:MFS transporter, putative metabolite transport protein